MATNEDNSRNKNWRWTNDKIGVATQSMLWLRVEVMTWQISRLEHLNGIQWSRFQVPLRPTFYSYFNEYFSSEYHIYHSFRYIHVITLRKVQLNKQWNRSGYSNLVLRASWTHDRIVQFVRVSEWNSVVQRSSPTQANCVKLLQRIH